MSLCPRYANFKDILKYIIKIVPKQSFTKLTARHVETLLYLMAKRVQNCRTLFRCVHKAGLVWTDLKLDNMVLCERDEARAIDLEGAVPARSAPKSYTPDTMPPDFAVASRGGVSERLSNSHRTVHRVVHGLAALFSIF